MLGICRLISGETLYLRKRYNVPAFGQWALKNVDVLVLMNRLEEFDSYKNRVPQRLQEAISESDEGIFRFQKEGSDDSRSVELGCQCGDVSMEMFMLSGYARRNCGTSGERLTGKNIS